MKLHDCFVVGFPHAVNGILGAGSYGIAMVKHFPYIKNISVAILKLQETSVLSKKVVVVTVLNFRGLCRIPPKIFHLKTTSSDLNVCKYSKLLGLSIFFCYLLAFS